MKKYLLLISATTLILGISTYPSQALAQEEVKEQFINTGPIGISNIFTLPEKINAIVYRIKNKGTSKNNGLRGILSLCSIWPAYFTGAGCWSWIFWAFYSPFSSVRIQVFVLLPFILRHGLVYSLSGKRSVSCCKPDSSCRFWHVLLRYQSFV